MDQKVEIRDSMYYWERSIARYPVEPWVRPRLDELIATLAKILAAESSAHEIITETLDPEAGFYVAYGLRNHPHVGKLYMRVNYDPVTRVLKIELNPTWIHKWMHKWAEQESIYMSVHYFIGPTPSRDLTIGSHCVIYPSEHTFRTPDCLFRGTLQFSPTIVFESEWKENYEDLHNSMVQWFKIATHVSLVYLCIFSKRPDNRIEGYLEVWGRGENGDETLLKEKPIFPIPEDETEVSSSRESIYSMKREQIIALERLDKSFRKKADPNDVFSFRIDLLRKNALEMMKKEGFTPAEGKVEDKIENKVGESVKEQADEKGEEKVEKK